MEFRDDSLPSVDKYFYNEFYATDTSCEKSIDLDTFFNLGKRKSEPKIQAPLEVINFKENRVFFNRVDTFNGKYIALFLSGKTFGGLGRAEDDEEGEGEEGEEEENALLESEIETEADENQEGATKHQSHDSKGMTDAAEIEMLFESLREYEYIDALYAKYDVSKLSVIEYGELLNLKTHKDRLCYLEQKFGVLKRHLLVENSTNTEIPVQKVKKKKMLNERYELVAILNPKVDESLTCIDEYLVYDKKNTKEFVSRLMKCGIYIFDITTSPNEIALAQFALDTIVDKLTAMQDANPDEFANSDVKVTFILLSTLMCWANSKPIDPETPDLPFTEADFKKRRAHVDYKNHLQLEKNLYAAGLKFKTKLRVLVIGIGGVYGHEESVLHYLFKLAWFNEEELPIIGKGKNLVPLIDIDDLAMLVHLVISNFPKTKYIFGIEKTVSTLKEITKAVSKGMGTGRVRRFPKQEAALLPEVSQVFYDLLTSNFNVQSNVLEEIQMNFKSELGFVENIKAIGKEFKRCRKLKAIKILIVGPPGVGKTTVSVKLSNYYDINYITLQRGIDVYVNSLKDKILSIETRINEKNRLAEEKKLREENKEEGEEEEDEVEEEDEPDEEEEDVEQRLTALKEELNEIQQRLVENEEKPDEEAMIKLIKKQLLSKSCQNQGFILDGYPTTLAQTRLLFGMSEEDKDDEDDESDEEKAEEEQQDEAKEDAIKVNKKILPNIVVCLDANDDFLYRTLLVNPEAIQNKLTEHDIYNKISKYRKINTDDNTLLIFFDDIELYPHIFNIESDHSIGLDRTVEKIMSLIGPACNYERQKLLEMEKRMKEDAAASFHNTQIRKHKEIKRLRRETIKRKLEMWAAEVDRMKEEEEELLAKECMPLRHYLVKFVLPTLTNGLIEVARVQPDDPVDYLAEYLFKENQDGRMFLEDREEPSEIKKMINMLFDFKNYLQGTEEDDNEEKSSILDEEDT